MRLLLAGLAALVLAAPRAAWAQALPPLQPGQTVRVFAPGAEIYRKRLATVLETNGDVVVLRVSGARQEIHASQIQSLDVSRGRETRTRSAGIGLVGGAALGAALSAVSRRFDDPEYERPAASNVTGWAVTLGVIGGAIGALVPWDRWEPVLLRAPVAGSSSPSGGLALSASFALP
jgi:hypothetical protein